MSEVIAESSSVDDLDLTKYELYRHGFPHEIFTRLRREAPVWRQPASSKDNEIGGQEFWVLSRYEDIQATSRAHETFAATRGPALFSREGGGGHMLTNMDGTGHTRLRKLIRDPHGLLLVTAPTGRGKTTTLYGALNELNVAEKKILTV